MKCQTCQHNIARRSKFCPNCGSRVEQRVQQQPSAGKPPFPFHWALIILAAGMILGIGILKLTETNQPAAATAGPVVAALPINSPQVLDIAKELNCPCGTCSDALATCDCDHENGAIAVKSFIAQKISEGHKKPHILQLVQAQFGAQKAQLAPLKFEVPKPGETPALKK